MIKGAIFDLDGTLIDSMFIWDNIAEDYLRSLGVEPKENLNEIFRTFTLEMSAEYYRNHYGITLSKEEITEGINNMVAMIYNTRVTIKPGVDDFLNRLKAREVKMCIATVTDRSITESVLKRLGIREYFSEIFVCDEVGYSKESPEIYNLALNHLGTRKEETVVFEDVYHALKTARDDGFKVAAVYDYYETRQEEMKELADYYIRDYRSFTFGTKMKTALTIAGSDSSGGAGIQADIKTMTMNGVYAMSVITSLTAQNTLGVRSIEDSSPEFLKQQMDAVFEDIFPDSIKIGMVSSGELIEVIADRLKYYDASNIVLDPVMISTSGSSLIKNDALEVLVHKLLPLATIVTPNILEAEVLSGIKISKREDMIKAAKYIGDTYRCSVLLKGGHSKDNADDLLYDRGRLHWFEGKRIDNPNTHGTGCTLSSAIASNLAKGFDICQSVKYAKEYVSDALSAMLDLGYGSGPIKHNFNIGS